MSATRKKVSKIFYVVCLVCSNRAENRYGFGRLCVVTNRYCLFMTIVLSHISALEYWLSVRACHPELQIVFRAKRYITKPASLIGFSLDLPQELNYPVHVLIADDSCRRHSKSIACHVWTGPLPKGCILEIGNGICVCSPEFCFVQMANTLSLPKLIELGYEFCGTYASRDEKLLQVEPLTTVSKMKSLISRMRGATGIKKAERASRYILENSASPMETRLAMLLCLPYKLGGYGFPRPQMNCRVDINPSLRGPDSPGYYVCDLLWPEAKLAIEYDSDKYHTGRSRITYDSMKRGNLNAMDVMVISITNTQIHSNIEMDKLAKTIARKTGKQIRYKEPEFSKARFQLREELQIPEFTKWHSNS